MKFNYTQNWSLPTSRKRTRDIYGIKENNNEDTISIQNNDSNKMPRYKKPKHNDSDYPNNVEEEEKIVTSNNTNLSKDSYNYVIASIKKSLKDSKRLLHIPIGIQEQI